MEHEGIRIDSQALADFSAQLSKEMAEHEHAIYRLAGREFNLNSPRQLGEILFQDLKLIGRAIGLPTTVLVDPAGCEIGTAAGPAEWASQDGIKLVRAALGE